MPATIETNKSITSPAVKKCVAAIFQAADSFSENLDYSFLTM
jgi:hypothetical protein